jgi:hypothetical protein
VSSITPPRASRAVVVVRRVPLPINLAFVAVCKNGQRNQRHRATLFAVESKKDKDRLARMKQAAEQLDRQSEEFRRLSAKAAAAARKKNDRLKKAG